MLEAILFKLYNTKETPEIFRLRQKVEIISQKLEYLESIEPKTDKDYKNTPLVLKYVKSIIELNIEIANIYTIDILE